MFLSNSYFKNYLDNIAQSPKQYYDDLNQATIDSLWEDTNRIDAKVQEQDAYPFKDTYTEYEAWIDNIAEANIAINKSVSDFISIWFKDCSHRTNYKGQYYKFSLDGINEDTYICYDTINPIAQMSECKVVRCNQVLTWADSNGKIHTMPCYLGSDITSTNNQYSKDGTIPNARLIICLQATEYTKQIKQNQRFMFQHNSAFKVEEVDAYEQETGANGDCTFVKLYVAWSPIVPTDNTELNLCNYTNDVYAININQSDISLIKGNTIQLTVTTIHNNKTEDFKILWTSSDETIATVDENGFVTSVATGSCKITATMDGNANVSDNIDITIVNDDTPIVENKKIIVSPTEEVELYSEDEQEYKVGVYDNNTLTNDEVVCTPNFVNDDIYTLVKVTNNSWKVTGVDKSKDNLTLTFSSGDLTPVTVTIKLRGVI